MKKKSVIDFMQMKKNKEQVAWITAYDYPTALFGEQAGMDMLLVGDSLGMLVMGYDSTIPVTMADCIAHCQSVRRGAPNTWVIGDMPFGAYQIADSDAVHNAVRFIKEAAVDCIKLEGGQRVASRIRAITDAGILVMGHIGLTPQSSGQLGGFKAQGRDVKNAREVIKDALAVEAAGAFSLLVEAVPPEVTAFIAQKLSIPVYSIGAGPCDGQLLISGDMLGQFKIFTPKFVKQYADIASVTVDAFKAYIDDVKKGAFPTDDHVYHIIEPEEDFKKLFDEFN
ncbi:MAG: 3-methyl-2-oxobutanoate hydroxymethyltransferase [Firmicutes bacterium ML8_F2]|jgi:3-methyl-2-oxobutanoate hydroxymethyltransferase|nr:MAG: 3-methyl-2-oxobutanoate hydroxymethyltransferase [Firmicutes bacterium ML8_F2]